jgi:hypothetical protein
MQQMKLFSSAACADDLAMLERMINEWIDGSGARIMQMTQSQFGTHLVICLIYMRGGEDTVRHAEASVAVPEVFERTMDDAELDPDEADRPLPQAELPY